MRNFLRIGKIISLHGIKGEVKIFPTTDNIKRFDDLNKFYIVDDEDAKDSIFCDKPIYISEGVKYIKNNCILKIKGFDKIEDSTKLIGQNIYISRADAVKLEENEYFIMDLIGIKCFKDDELIGNVKDIMTTKANSILVVDYDTKDLLIPMVSDFVEKVDIVNSIIKIKTIEGLIWKLI